MHSLTASLFLYHFLLRERPEDFIADQFREELGEETEDDSDDLEKDPRIVLIPLLMVLGVGLAGYSRRRRLALTGRHKKNDF